MIRNAGDCTHNSTSDNVKLSLRDFPKNRSLAAKVELMHFDILKFLHLWQFLQHTGNISINVNTTKAFVTDHDQDMDKADV